MKVAHFSGLAAGTVALIATLAAAAPGTHDDAVTNMGIGLEAVSADSPTDAWAAGVTGADDAAVVIHWNGTSWTRVAVPDPRENTVSGLSALSSTDAWAVGTGPGRSAQGGLTLHWDGTSWTPAATPSLPMGYLGYLNSVSALSASDAFAVGDVAKPRDQLKSTDLALRWNGTSWTSESVPSPGVESYLVSMSADSPSDAWAIGNYYAGKNLLSVAEHWNGSTWTQVATPNPGPAFTLLNSVSAVSASDVWALGSYFVGTREKVLILHWNGTKWAQVSTPSLADDSLASISADSANDVWAVGGRPNGTLALHWNGTSWTRVAAPSPLAGGSSLTGVSAVSATSAWAVGCDCPQGKKGPRSLLLEWNGKSWQRT